MAIFFTRSSRLANLRQRAAEHLEQVKNAEILAVSYIAANKCCISCKAKVDNLDDNIGMCTKCCTTQFLDKCGKHLSAKVIIGNKEQTYSLYAFLPMIQKIVQNDAITDDEYRSSHNNATLF